MVIRRILREENEKKKKKIRNSMIKGQGSDPNCSKMPLHLSRSEMEELDSTLGHFYLSMSD